jgi:hypothetical protein
MRAALHRGVWPKEKLGLFCKMTVVIVCAIEDSIDDHGAAA